MGHAYTPGLKVTKASIVRKERKLPLKGEVLVNKGDMVDSDKIVARTELPGDVTTLNIAGKLGIMPSELPNFMKKKEGEPVEKGEVIAESKGFLGLFSNRIESPIQGTVESVSVITGQVILRAPPEPVEIDAYVDGKVVEIIKDEGVVIETVATFVQGIFGIGGEVKGSIQTIVDKPSDIVDENTISPDMKDKVLIGGSYVTADGLKKAVSIGAKALVVGGIDDKDLKDFLGYEIGVAITGQEKKGITLVITEGFGKMNMSEKAFTLLSSQSGKKASVNGATQIRAGVMRPEIIIPLPDTLPEDVQQKEAKGLEIGDIIRVIRDPFFGAIGKVVSLPPELTTIETESKARVLEVEIEGGKRITLPRANVELIEE